METHQSENDDLDVLQGWGSVRRREGASWGSPDKARVARGRCTILNVGISKQKKFLIVGIAGEFRG